MASGDGIDSIELESTASNSNNRNVEASSAACTSDDHDRDHASGADGRSTNQEVYGEAELPRTEIHRQAKTDKEKKIGHRRVGDGGQITYKKIQTSTIMGSIQLGIQHTVGSLASKPKRDLLMMDFWEIETISFPPEGSSLTPAHHFSEFRFKIYAPIAFRYFRHLFGIQPDDFMMSMCSSPLRELSNPGASGSIFYLTDDDEFIIKTVQHKEGEFLQKLLPGYYMNLSQNPRTLLPKFFGLYCFQCNSKNIRMVVMNNLLPSYVKLHYKYDLKGSTYKRRASKAERSKKSPTFKDLDFMEHHPNGIFLEADTYNALIKTIQRDCTVLESFKIMDYSLLVGVHNLDSALKEKQEERRLANERAKNPRNEESDTEDDPPHPDSFIATEREREEREREIREKERGAAAAAAAALNRSRSINRQRLVAHSTAMESIQAESEPIDEEEDVPPGGIPARSERGERLLLFIGIIDILQSYRLKKKLEHTFKSIIHDGDTVSVCRPSFYAQRFQNFMAKTVFKKIPSPLKHSPSKRKSLSRVAQRSSEGDSESHPVAGSSHHHHHHHLSNTSQKSVVAQSSAAVMNSKQPITTTTPSPIVVTSLKQKTNITKSKVPPPVPPRGSPKTRKGQMQTGRNGGNLASRASPTGSKQLPIVSKNDKKHTLQLEERVPKFGDRLSPSNVRDWLELNFAESFVEKNAEPQKPAMSPIPLGDVVTFSRPPSNKGQDLQRRNSFLSQSGRSSIGSIVRGFPLMSLNENKKTPRRDREQKAKREYLQYVDMVIRENDDDQDNIVTSLTSIVEFRNEIEAKPERKFTNKKNEVSKRDADGRKRLVSLATVESKYVTHRTPSIILEDSDYSQSVDSLYHMIDDNNHQMNNSKIKMHVKRCLDETLTNFSREGELV